MNNKNKRNRNKKNKGAQEDKPDDSTLPNDESTADMTHNSDAAKNTNTQDDDTEATADSTKARAGTRDPDAVVGDEGQGKKKRKKRANKRTVAMLKQIRKDFMDRCVSPNYQRANRLQLNGEISLRNLKGLSNDELDAPYLNTRSKKKIHKKPQAAEATTPQDAQPDLGWFNNPDKQGTQTPGNEDLTK